MRKTIKYLKVCCTMWHMLNFYVQMQMWYEANNMCVRIERFKADRWFVYFFKLIF